jgi:hypothetical protein
MADVEVDVDIIEKAINELVGATIVCLFHKVNWP